MTNQPQPQPQPQHHALHDDHKPRKSWIIKSWHPTPFYRIVHDHDEAKRTAKQLALQNKREFFVIAA